MAKIIVVGIGPGNFDDMTPRARKAIENASVVAGYKTYINLIEPLLEGKEVIGTGMTQEIDRCKAAVEAAATLVFMAWQAWCWSWYCSCQRQKDLNGAA